ncbi:Hypothetical protein A7982_04935 [Minicystis rosea]|nr:Hypothetical protein A7982_04935 [Minicystis rosea]
MRRRRTRESETEMRGARAQFEQTLHNLVSRCATARPHPCGRRREMARWGERFAALGHPIRRGSGDRRARP